MLGGGGFSDRLPRVWNSNFPKTQLLANLGWGPIPNADPEKRNLSLTPLICLSEGDCAGGPSAAGQETASFGRAPLPCYFWLGGGAGVARAWHRLVLFPLNLGGTAAGADRTRTGRGSHDRILKKRTRAGRGPDASAAVCPWTRARGWKRVRATGRVQPSASAGSVAMRPVPLRQRREARRGRHDLPRGHRGLQPRAQTVAVLHCARAFQALASSRMHSPRQTAEDASVSSQSIVWDASGTRPLPFPPVSPGVQNQHPPRPPRARCRFSLCTPCTVQWKKGGRAGGRAFGFPRLAKSHNLFQTFIWRFQ
eukprot:gene25042-biopygen7451